MHADSLEINDDHDPTLNTAGQPVLRLAVALRSSSSSKFSLLSALRFTFTVASPGLVAHTHTEAQARLLTVDLYRYSVIASVN